MVVDALGNPLRLLLTGGQDSEYGQAELLISGYSADYVLGDKGYDSNAFVEAIKASGAEAVIPPRANRIETKIMIKFSIKNAIWWNAFSRN